MKAIFFGIVLTLISSCSQTNKVFSKRRIKASRLPASKNSFDPKFIGSDIGTIKYSILNEPTFQKINGEGWVLMDGKSFPGSDYHTLTGKIDIPDARGRFLRMLDHGSNRDPGRNEMGSNQADTFRAHRHSISGQKHPHTSDYLGGSTANYGLNHTYDRNNYQYKQVISDEGGVETRPKNIAVNVFIKINDN